MARVPVPEGAPTSSAPPPAPPAPPAPPSVQQPPPPMVQPQQPPPAAAAATVDIADAPDAGSHAALAAARRVARQPSVVLMEEIQEAWSEVITLEQVRHLARISHALLLPRPPSPTPSSSHLLTSGVSLLQSEQEGKGDQAAAHQERALAAATARYQAAKAQSSPAGAATEAPIPEE